MNDVAQNRTVNGRLVMVIGLGMLSMLVEGCSISHQTMRGSVVAIVDKEAHICIGSGDGLKVGDTLTVYRTRQVGFPTLPYGAPRSPGEIERSFRYERTKVGKVTVTRIFDEHFAAVAVVTGEVDYPDVVEKSLIP